MLCPTDTQVITFGNDQLANSCGCRITSTTPIDFEQVILQHSTITGHNALFIELCNDTEYFRSTYDSENIYIDASVESHSGDDSQNIAINRPIRSQRCIVLNVNRHNQGDWSGELRLTTIFIFR